MRGWSVHSAWLEQSGPRVGAAWVRFHAAGAAATNPKEPARSGGRLARAEPAARSAANAQNHTDTAWEKKMRKWQRH